MREKCLGHLKVLELCNGVAGPYCTKILADLGAEVIKIERPGAGDESRSRGPYLNYEPHPEKSGLYLYLNTNKLGITLDIQTTTGRRILGELVEQTDILVEDNPAAFVEEMGFKYEALQKLNPRLVMTCITPFGRMGPYSDYRGYELNCFHGGGEGFMLPIESQYPDREPVKGGGLEPDCICGLSAALATLAAVYRMQITGMGQHIDVSKQDVLMTMVGLEVSHYAHSGMVRTRHRRKAFLAVPVECEDGFVMITPFPDPQWKAFSRFTGNDIWAEDERYTNMVNRWQNADEINNTVNQWVKKYKKEELFHELQAELIAAAPVNTSKDIVESTQMNGRGFFNEVEHPKAGKLKYPTTAYKLSATPSCLERPAPLLGEHNRMIYSERLGYSGNDLVTMAENGVI